MSHSGGECLQTIGAVMRAIESRRSTGIADDSRLSVVACRSRASSELAASDSADSAAVVRLVLVASCTEAATCVAAHQQKTRPLGGDERRMRQPVLRPVAAVVAARISLSLLAAAGSTAIGDHATPHAVLAKRVRGAFGMSTTIGAELAASRLASPV